MPTARSRRSCARRSRSSPATASAARAWTHRRARGVNKRLIYYYFGSKDELFLAVLEQTYADIRAAEHELHLEASDPLEAMRRLVAFTWNYYLEHPEFLTLLNSENLHRARPPEALARASAR